MRIIENHVERCHCWECGGYGKKEYEQAVPDPIRGGDLVGVFEECDGCEGVGELLRAKITQTTVIRAFSHRQNTHSKTSNFLTQTSTASMAK